MVASQYTTVSMICAFSMITAMLRLIPTRSAPYIISLLASIKISAISLGVNLDTSPDTIVIIINRVAISSMYQPSLIVP